MIYRGIVVIWFVKVMVDSPTVMAGLILSSAIVMDVYMLNMTNVTAMLTVA